MNKEIHYETTEGQEFQAKPHISVVPSLEIDKKWQVDLRWREDTSSSRVDAEFNFIDGMDFLDAFEEGIEYGNMLNVPVAQYANEKMWLVQEPEAESDGDQEKRLKFLMQGSTVKKIPTH